jgi:hypothetical protein
MIFKPRPLGTIAPRRSGLLFGFFEFLPDLEPHLESLHK